MGFVRLSPLSVAPLYHSRISVPGGSSFVNVSVDAGSSSVRIQQVTCGEMLRAGIRIKPTLAAGLSSLVRSRELSLTIAGGTR